MRRPERLATLALLLAALHGPAPARPMPCTLVFGQARNLPEAGGPDWQALNEDFSAAVAAALDGSGRRIVTMSLPNDRIDARATGLALLQRADESGCNTLIEATVFADVEQILVLRLRVYPLLPRSGATAASSGCASGRPCSSHSASWRWPPCPGSGPNCWPPRWPANTCSTTAAEPRASGSAAAAPLQCQQGQRRRAQQQRHQAGPVHPLPAAGRDQGAG